MFCDLHKNEKSPWHWHMAPWGWSNWCDFHWMKHKTLCKKTAVFQSFSITHH